MQQNFDPILKFFSITGLFQRKFDGRKSFRENCLTLWSLIIFGFFFSTVTIQLWIIINFKAFKNFLELFTALFLTICVFSVLVSVVVLKRFDMLFWKLVNEFQSIFIHQIGMQTNTKIYRIRFWFKIIRSSFVILSCQTSICFIMNYPIFLIFPGIFWNLFLIKFDFYVDVLRFCLKNIESKLSRKFISKHDTKCLKNVYTVCWTMS